MSNKVTLLVKNGHPYFYLEKLDNGIFVFVVNSTLAGDALRVEITKDEWVDLVMVGAKFIDPDTFAAADVLSDIFATALVSTMSDRGKDQ